MSRPAHLLPARPSFPGRLIVTLWRRCSGRAAEHPESDAEGEGRVGGSGLRQQGSGGMLMRPVSKLLRRVTRPGEWEGGSPRHSLLLAAAAAPAPRQEQSEPILTGAAEGAWVARQWWLCLLRLPGCPQQHAGFCGRAWRSDLLHICKCQNARHVPTPAAASSLSLT